MNLAQFSFPTGAYYFEQPWTLDGVTYVCTLRFNLRVQTWFLDLADGVGNDLVAGVPLLAYRDLLAQYATRGVPSGLMYVADSSGQARDPGQDDFSLTHALLYVSSS